MPSSSRCIFLRAEPMIIASSFCCNIDINEQYGTGCLFCLESCSLGITSDSAYQYCEPMEFTLTHKRPAAGTKVTIVYTAK